MRAPLRSLIVSLVVIPFATALLVARHTAGQAENALPGAGGFAEGREPRVLGGDAVPDIIISPGSAGQPTRILSGATFGGLGAGFPFGAAFGASVRTAAGELSGDSVADIVVAMGPGGGLVRLYNGATIGEIASGYPFGADFAGGVSVATGDINGDGRADIIVGQASSGGTVRAFSGANLSVLLSLTPFGASYTGGLNVATGDVDGDGRADVIVGQASGGLVSIISGATQQVILSGAAYGNLPGGVFVAAGDVTGDGRAEVIAAPGTGNLPILVYNVHTGVVVTTLTPYASAPGGARVAVTDTTGDGRVEILTVPGPGAPPELRVYDGATFATLSSQLVYPADYLGGAFVSAVPPSALRFVSPVSTTFLAGSPGSFTVTVQGNPLATAIQVSGALPSGISFTSGGNGTATLAGTAGPASSGIYPLTFTASNSSGTQVVQNFTLTVGQAPAVTSAASSTFTAGVNGTFSVVTSGFPTPTVVVTGTLPAGLTFVDNGNGTGTLSGTPSAASGGQYVLNVSADNGLAAAANQSFTLTVNAAPTFTSGAATAFTVGFAGSFTVTTTGYPTPTIAASGPLPSGVSFTNNGNGTATLAGTPAPGTVGGYPVTITASNGVGSNATQPFTFTVAPTADAQNETYSNGVGNTQYSVGAGTPPTPAVVVSGSVLGNDTGAAPLSAGPASIATTNGGQVQMASNGSFLFTPALGFAGPSDSFTYVLTDGNGRTDTATVTINMSGVVWYVNAAAVSGDGRSQSPLSTMDAASVAAQAGQTIYVHQGSPTGTTTLKSSQTLWGAGAAFALNGLSIAATSSPALQGTITLANGVLVGALSVNGGVGTAIGGTSLTGVETLNGVSIVGGATGLSLTNVSGTVTMTGGAISGVTGTDVDISGGTAAITISASVSNTAGRSVSVQNRTGGSVAFLAPIVDTGLGVLLNSNTGSTVSFAGGLSVTTFSADAFTATGGGTLTVTQDNVTVVNTLASTSGTALTVSNTEIGAAGITFRSIAAGSAILSPGAGIVLDTTGTGPQNAGLTVTGAGTALSGGIIRRKTGPDGSTTQGVGIYLNNTKNASFSWMDLNNLDNSGIVGRNVNGFSLLNSSITTAGTSALVTEGPLVFGLPAPTAVNGLTGTGLIRDSVITGGYSDNAAFFNQSGVMVLVVERTPTQLPGACLIGNNSAATGTRGLVLQMSGTATATVTANRCRFRNNRTTALDASATENSTLGLTVTGSATDDLLKAELVRSTQGDSGIVVSNSGNAQLSARIENAIFSGFPAGSIHAGQQPGNATALSLLQVSITGNRIDSALGSTASAISARLSSTPGLMASTRILVADNTDPSGIFHAADPPAISITTPDAGTVPDVDITLRNNHVDMIENPAASGIRGLIGMSVVATNGSLCANVINNTSHWFPPDVTPQGGGIRLQQAGGTVALERGSEPLSSSAGTVLATNNPPPTTFTMVTEALGTIAVVENGTCQLPTP